MQHYKGMDTLHEKNYGYTLRNREVQEGREKIYAGGGTSSKKHLGSTAEGNVWKKGRKV